MSLLKNAYALLIGIAYEDGLNTIVDAEDVAEILSDENLCGYRRENVLLCTGEKADRKGILKAFDELVKKTDENSSVFIYYSGHGDVLEGVFHFVPHGIVEGMTFEEYTAAWVTAEEIKDRINKLQTRRLIFFMDCCHATGIATAGFNPRLSSSVASQDLADGKTFGQLEGLAQKVDNERGISIVASCKEEQESYQLNGDRNSLFTKYLLLALRGQHLSEFKDPYVRILEVAGYLLKVIPETIQQVAKDCDPPLDIRQEPYVNLEMYDNFILSYIPRELRKKVGAATPEEDGQKGEATAKQPRLIFRETPGANNLILFIHGFTGEGSETFGSLPDMLMQDPELEGWDMKPFGYSSFIQPEHGKNVWGGIKDIARITDYLCTSVKYKFDKYDRIAIVAHGLGGLIAQRALLDFSEDNHNKVSHLILLACPSNGLSAEELQAAWNKEYSEIGSQGTFIKELRKEWDTRYPEGPHFSLRAVAATEDQFVAMESCFAPFPKVDCFSLAGDHFSVVKPADKDAEAYQLVRKTLTHSELFAQFGDPQARNLALGRYDAVVKELLPMQEELDQRGLIKLVFALEGMDRREEAMAILDTHPVTQGNTDLMGILGGRYKRAYLKRPNRKDGEAAEVYYSIALETSREQKDHAQIYYHSINLAFLSLVIQNDRNQMKYYAEMALEASKECEDTLWTQATKAEAHLYLGNLELARKFYEKAAAMAGIREKISIHLNAHAAYTQLWDTHNPQDPFIVFLKEQFLT